MFPCFARGRRCLRRPCGLLARDRVTVCVVQAVVPFDLARPESLNEVEKQIFENSATIDLVVDLLRGFIPNLSPSRWTPTARSCPKERISATDGGCRAGSRRFGAVTVVPLRVSHSLVDVIRLESSTLRFTGLLAPLSSRFRQRNQQCVAVGPHSSRGLPEPSSVLGR